MLIYSIIALLLSLAYCFVIRLYVKGWSELPVFNVPEGFTPNTSISILIPARNEEQNIESCIQSILNQKYPPALFEIIIIDDHSTDQTVARIQTIADQRIKLLSLSDHINEKEGKSFKKKAIELGIAKAQGQLILNTDADCIVQDSWLLHFAAMYQEKQVRFIAAPVNFHQEQSTFEYFQSLDFMGMMAVSGAGIQLNLMNMCNGANLAYERKTFFEVDGFKGIDNLASGDDILLMQKIAKRFPQEIAYLKNIKATTYTKAISDLSGFIQQRIRWATKSGAYPEPGAIIMLAIVFLFCINILLGFFLIPLLGILLLIPLILQIGIKIIADYIFLGKMAKFFNRSDAMRFFLPAQFMHILYIAFIGSLSNVKKTYTWKGRKTK